MFSMPRIRPIFLAKVLIAGLILIAHGSLHATAAIADVFGSGEHTFEIAFVAIGDPGNPADTKGFPNPAGSVPYSYRIGKYEISKQMIDKANALGGLGIMHDGRGPNKPVTSISWFEAAHFVNWLNTSTGNTPAYKFDANGDFQLWEPDDPGYNPDNLFRNSEAKYFFPSADEWYKAAFYDPTTSNGTWNQYPTGGAASPIPVASGTDPGTAVFLQAISVGPADITQAGGLSPYGTMGQGGNVWEWQEANIDLGGNDPLSTRIFRGGAWTVAPFSISSSSIGSGLPSAKFAGVGFRVASVIPEPSTAPLLGLGFIGGLLIRRWNRKAQ